MVYKALIEICPHSGAKAIYTTMKAEEMQPAPGRGRVRVRMENGCIEVEVESRDLTGLRAVLNSYLHLAYAAYSSITALER